MVYFKYNQGYNYWLISVVAKYLGNIFNDFSLRNLQKFYNSKCYFNALKKFFDSHFKEFHHIIIKRTFISWLKESLRLCQFRTISEGHDKYSLHYSLPWIKEQRLNPNWCWCPGLGWCARGNLVSQKSRKTVLTILATAWSPIGLLRSIPVVLLV